LILLSAAYIGASVIPSGMIGSFSDIKTIMSGSLSPTSQADLARALTRRADRAPPEKRALLEYLKVL
jgi:hypothetical protein